MRDNQPLPDGPIQPPAQLRGSCCVTISAMPKPKVPSKAFTRLELLAVLCAIALLATLVAPAVATSKTDSERIICFNNLRLVGRGVQAWAGDHNQQLPWWTPTTDGGEFISQPGGGGGARPGNAWIEYAFMSNELATPKILACPSDAGARRAADWAQLISSPYRGLALSYPLHLHASPDAPATWLSTDQNLLGSVAAGGCASGINNVHQVFPGFSGWTNGVVHGVFGHVLLMDGSVEFTSTQRLNDLLNSAQIVPGDPMHFLKAR